MGPGTSYQYLSGLQNMFKKIPFLVIYHPGDFDDLIQSSFSVISKITFVNLWKPIHDFITFQFSSDPLNLETVERMEKKYTK